jgi:hypothetical protein
MSPRPARIVAAGCRTALGDADQTCAALLAGKVALSRQPALGAAGGDPVPLALCEGRALDEAAPPAWLPLLDELAARIPRERWGAERFPVFVTSSNFGIGSLYAYHRTRDPEHLSYGAPGRTVDVLRRRFGWGENVTILSHACVSAQVGLLAAARALENGAAQALVFTFDFLSPFVAGGFGALKILNGLMPAPYANRPEGSIGLGDGAAFAVVAATGGEAGLEAQSLHNEMHHFTANRADGAGFAACFEPIARVAGGRRIWIKGHGTGTLESGRLEAEAARRHFPESPLVSWKGSLGHTLGSCALVELAVTLATRKRGQVPGTVGTSGTTFTDTVALAPLELDGYDGAVLACNAFGGAHAACLLTYD